MSGTRTDTTWIRDTKPLRMGANYVLTFMLVTLSTLSYVPSPFQIRSILFVFAYVCFFFIAVAFNNWRAVSFKWFLLSLFSLFALAGNFFVSAIGDIHLDKWLRSFVPMFFFFTVVAAPFYVRLLGCGRVLQLMLLSCFSYCVFLLILNPSAFIDFIKVGGRLTFYLQDSVVPYPYIGIILAVLLPRIRLPVRIFLVLFFAFFVLAVGYKMQIIFLFVFGVYLAFIASRGAQKIFYISVFFVGASLLFVFLGDYLVQRFSSIGGGGDEVRMLEVRYAWDIFSDQPIWGGGLGTEVPLSLTRPGYAGISNLWETDTVSYIHNFPMYLLMVGGAVFFIIFLAMLQFAGLFSVANLKSIDQCTRSAMWCAVALLIFFLTSAAFKQVQSVIMLSFFIAVLTSSRKVN